MQQQIACRHLRTGCIAGRHKCRLNDHYVDCVGLIVRCECQTLRQSHDRWMPTTAPVSMVVLATRRTSR